MLYHPKGDGRLVMDKNSPRTYFLIALLILVVAGGICWLKYGNTFCEKYGTYNSITRYSPVYCITGYVVRLFK